MKLTEEQRDAIKYARAVMGSQPRETSDGRRAKAVIDALLAAHPVADAAVAPSELGYVPTDGPIAAWQVALQNALVREYDRCAKIHQASGVWDSCYMKIIGDHIAQFPLLHATPTPTVAADAVASTSGMERAFSSEAMGRRDQMALLNRHAETPRLLALLGLPLIDSIALYDVRVRLEHALDASEGKLDEEAHVAQRMTETLAEVYATIIGDDPQRDDDSLNAIERVKKAAQVLRLEVELYRAQAAAQPDERAAFTSALILAICELPDRTSPDDEPGAMVANADEIASCVERACENACLRIVPDGAASQTTVKDDERAVTWQDAFDKRHEFDVYPDHFMTGLRNEFCAGWQAHAASQVELWQSVRNVHDTFRRDIEQGYSTRDKQFAIELLAPALGRSPITNDCQQPYQWRDTGPFEMGEAE